MASGDTLNVFTPLGNEPPSANYATLDLRNSHPVLEFDAATVETSLFTSVLPRNYLGGGLTITIIWAGDTATSGDVVWRSYIERLEAGGTDTDSDSFASAQTTTGTANGTSGILTYTTITHSSGANMDSLAVGEAFRLKIDRFASDSGDTMTGDAQLFSVEIKET